MSNTQQAALSALQNERAFPGSAHRFVKYRCRTYEKSLRGSLRSTQQLDGFLVEIRGLFEARVALGWLVERSVLLERR